MLPCVSDLMGDTNTHLKTQGADMTAIHHDHRMSRDSAILPTLATLFIAGGAALLSFDFFGQALAPMLGLAKLSPVGLANGTLKAVLGISSQPAAVAMHYATGLLAYPLGWMLVAEPLYRRLTPGLPWAVAAVAYGVALWIFALYVMAHLVVGMPAFLGWGGLTWVALAGHVLFALVAAAVFRARTRA